MKRFLLFAGLLVVALAIHARGSLEVVPLRHRSAEQVIPVLRPLLDAGGALSGQGYQLFIRTSPGNLQDLRRALATIDTPQRRLVISVRFDATAEASRSAIDARGTLRSGDVTISNQRFPNERTQVEARVLSSRGASDERVDQRVQVLEGGRAFISTGLSRPLPQRQVVVGPAGVAVQETTVIQNLDTGFEVTPRVSGNTVFLDINPQRETPGALGQGSVQSQRVSSSLSAALGEWVELGGAIESTSSSGGGTLSSRDARAGSARRVWVRVEELRP
jgi:type II secretory pathway component GspD/PulD (secretin)